MTGKAQREGLFIDMLACQTQSKETVCVEEGSRHESMRPSGRSQCTNQRDECIESCVSASTPRTGACEGLGSGCTGPRLVVIHRLSLARLSRLNLGWRDRLYHVLLPISARKTGASLFSTEVNRMPLNLGGCRAN